LGIKHVNIIDTCCRVFSFSTPPPPYIQRQHSYHEKKRGKLAQERLAELGHGGKRTKRN
jgi:hypothetical protein